MASHPSFCLVSWVDLSVHGSNEPVAKLLSLRRFGNADFRHGRIWSVPVVTLQGVGQGERQIVSIEPRAPDEYFPDHRALLEALRPAFPYEGGNLENSADSASPPTRRVKPPIALRGLLSWVVLESKRDHGNVTLLEFVRPGGPADYRQAKTRTVPFSFTSTQSRMKILLPKPKPHDGWTEDQIDAALGCAFPEGAALEWCEALQPLG